MSATTAGVVLGILNTQHADCIVLSGSERMPLAVGVTLEPIPLGAPVTVIYTRNGDGKMVVQSMTCSTALAREATGVSYGGLRV